MATKFDFSGKVALVTGGGSGIGRAACVKFAEAGASVLVADIDFGKAREVAAIITQAGGTALAQPLDVSNGESVRNAIEVAVTTFGSLDVIVPNAGIALAKLVEDTSEEEYDRLMNINLKGVFWCAKYAIPHMKRQGSGAIVINASKVGLVAQTNSPVYCATKGGAIQLAKALALDYATQNIRVNAICPGIVDTPLLESYFQQFPDPASIRAEFNKAQPIGRLATAEECADAILYLASDAASFITGIALPVDGGFTAM